MVTAEIEELQRQEGRLVGDLYQTLDELTKLRAKLADARSADEQLRREHLAELVRNLEPGLLPEAAKPAKRHRG